MRPTGRFVCCCVALLASAASAQTNDLKYPAPTIHNSGQSANAIPLPPLSASNSSAGQASNAAWVSGPRPQANSQAANSQPDLSQYVGAQHLNTNTVAPSSDPRSVVPASYATPAVAPVSNAERTGTTRTPLNPRKPQVSADASKSSSSSTIKMLISVGSSLLIVIGLFLGVAWCYRKTLNTSMGGLPKHVVSVIGRTAIAPRQQLLLVRFGSKLVLVSMVQGEARTISEITDPLEVDQLAGACESHQPHSLTNSFRSILNQNGGGAI